MPLAVNISDTVMDDLVGDAFALGVKWELEGADDEDICMEERFRNIGGAQLRKPTVRSAEWVEGEYGAGKNI